MLKHDIELLLDQKPHLEDFTHRFLNYTDKISLDFLHGLYGQVISNAQVEDIFALSDTCILRFTELKINSLHIRI